MTDNPLQIKVSNLGFIKNSYKSCEKNLDSQKKEKTENIN